MDLITAKQESYLISLCAKVSGRQYRMLAQYRDITGWTSWQSQRGITKAMASAKISELKGRAAA